MADSAAKINAWIETDDERGGQEDQADERQDQHVAREHVREETH
jgi:hypothetical protein